METIYLTRIHWRDHEQEILLSVNEEPKNLWIPEEVRLDYSDAVCRYNEDAAAQGEYGREPINHLDLLRILGLQRQGEIRVKKTTADRE